MFAPFARVEIPGGVTTARSHGVMHSITSSQGYTSCRIRRHRGSVRRESAGSSRASPRDFLEVCTSYSTVHAARYDGAEVVHVKRGRVWVEQVPETFQKFAQAAARRPASVAARVA